MPCLCAFCSCRRPNKQQETSKDGIFGHHCDAATVTKNEIEQVNDLLKVRPNEETALHLVAHYTHPTVIPTLLDAGIPSERQEDGDYAPTDLAAEASREQLVSLWGSADTNKSAVDGPTLVMLAPENGDLPTPKALSTAAANISCKEDEGWSALDWAASAGHIVVMRRLLQDGTDVMSRSPLGVTALHQAAKYNHAAAVNFLVEAGADVEARDYHHQRAPLHVAAQCDSGDAISALLGTRTPLYCGGKQCDVELRQNVVPSSLQGGGANVNLLAAGGWTALMFAAQHGKLSAARALLRAGADVALRTEDKWSALDYASSTGHADVMRELLRYGADVMSRCPSGFTALHIAAKNDHGIAVHVLVEAGADIEAREECSYLTPLHFAAYHGCCESLAALLLHGVNVRAKDGNGHCPLMLACMGLQEKAADLLLRWGADETRIDNWGRSIHQSVGARIPDGQRQARAEDVGRMRKLLERAPADRAWRRRGLLVLCRTLQNKVRVRLVDHKHLGDDSDLKGMSGRCRSNRGDAKKNFNTGQVGSGQADKGGVAVEAVVVGLDHDDLFRGIILYL